MAANSRKKNVFAAYFKPFGLRQVCDFLMLIGAIVMIVGLFTSDIVLYIGLSMYVVASVLSIIRSIRILTSGVNKRSPEYKNAIINIIIMSVILVIAVFGLVYSIYVGRMVVK